MKPRRSLTHRITTAFVLLALLLSSFFCLVSWLAIEVIESQVIDARLDKIADTLIAHHLRSERIDPPPEIAFFANAAIPAPLQASAPGVHELQLDERMVAALVREEGGNRYAVLQEINDFEYTELLIFSALGTGLVSSLLLAVFLGMATARHIAAPVTDLAAAVSANVAPEALPSLSATDEIGVLARAFARHTETLQDVLLRERLFTGDVSHELRTPLTIMLGAAELLTLQLADQPAKQAIAERLRRVAAESAERVSALLLLSRAPEQLGAPRIDLNALVSAEMERCLPLLRDKPVQILFEQAAQVQVAARPELLSIAIGNLLRNACQHTDAGSIRIRLRQDSLCIEDTGSGVPESVRRHLFERFVQGNPEAVESTGLGLAIVRRVVRHLGWEVRLEVPQDGGSRFVISLPAAAPDVTPDVTASLTSTLTPS